MTTAFTPPKPEPVTRNGFFGRLKFLRSALSAFVGSSYSMTGVGRHRIPTLPWFRMRELFTVRDPYLIREMLVRRSEDFPKAGMMDDMLNALTGYSIFVSNGEVWKRQRRIIEPALEGARVRDVFARMRDAADAGATESRATETGKGGS